MELDSDLAFMCCFNSFYLILHLRVSVSDHLQYAARIVVGDGGGTAGDHCPLWQQSLYCVTLSQGVQHCNDFMPLRTYYEAVLKYQGL